MVLKNNFLTSAMEKVQIETPIVIRWWVFLKTTFKIEVIVREIKSKAIPNKTNITQETGKWLAKKDIWDINQNIFI